MNEREHITTDPINFLNNKEYYPKNLYAHKQLR